jgi:hypothetical protein
MNTRAAMLESGARQFITKPDKFFEWELVLKEVINAYH